MYAAAWLPSAIPLLRMGLTEKNIEKTATIPTASKATATAIATATAQRNNIKRFNRARAVNKIAFAVLGLQSIVPTLPQPLPTVTGNNTPQ